jgi:hypothetical protein
MLSAWAWKIHDGGVEPFQDLVLSIYVDARSGWLRAANSGSNSMS